MVWTKMYTCTPTVTYMHTYLYSVGSTVCTEMPHLAISSRRPSAKDTVACLDMLYAENPGNV